MRIALLAASLLLLAACQGQESKTEQWEHLGGDWRGQRSLAQSEITAGDLDRLGLAFEFRDFMIRGRTHRGVEATPLMVDGTLYFSGPWGISYALDARTGEHRWTYDPDADGEAARNACCDAVNRGAVISGDRLFVAATDGQLAAVDRHSGEELWKVDTIYRHDWNYSSTGAPQVAGDLVVIGNSGGDMGSRGYVSAYDQASGELKWRFWIVPGDPEEEPDENPDVTAARATWPEDTDWSLGLGGNAWDAIAYDPETATVFVGTGNGGPHPAWLRSQSGEMTDQLYLSSIVALDAENGRVKWHYQTTPGDSWDYAATSPLIMAELEIGGETRSVIMQAPKNGFFYVLDRLTGELLEASPYTPVNWASHVDMETGRPVLTEDAIFRDAPKVIWPSMAGGHAWTPMAFSPKTGLTYLQVYDAPASYATVKAEFRPGSTLSGARNGFPPFEDPDLQRQFEAGPSQVIESRLKAWDPVSGTAKWTSEPLPFLSGGTLVIGDIVLQGSSDGFLTAYDAETGEVLRRIEIGTAILAAPMSYYLDGEQYVAILAGYAGPGAAFPPDSAAMKYENFERLVVLKLDGGEIPMPPPLANEVQQPMPEPIAASAQTMERGRSLYQTTCNRCHMLGGSRSNYPNLWNMAPGTIDAFEAIVGEGALVYGGMGDFSNVLSKPDIAALKAFIVNDTIEKRQEGQQAGAHYREASH